MIDASVLCKDMVFAGITAETIFGIWRRELAINEDKDELTIKYAVRAS